MSSQVRQIGASRPSSNCSISVPPAAGARSTTVMPRTSRRGSDHVGRGQARAGRRRTPACCGLRHAGADQRRPDVGLLAAGRATTRDQLGPLEEGQLAVAEVVGERPERLGAQRHRRRQRATARRASRDAQLSRRRTCRRSRPPRSGPRRSGVVSTVVDGLGLLGFMAASCGDGCGAGHTNGTLSDQKWNGAEEFAVDSLP